MTFAEIIRVHRATPEGEQRYSPAEVVSAPRRLSARILGLELKASQLEKAAMAHGIVMDRTKRLLQDLKISHLEDSHLVRGIELDCFRMSLSALDEPPSERVKEGSWKKALEEFPSEQAWTML